jgi:hypothetical protein
MVKTTVYLPERTRQRLRTAARLEGVAEAEIIRQAIDARIADAGKGFVLRDAPFHSSNLDATSIDELLADGFGE